MLKKNFFNLLFIGALLFLSLVYSYHRELFRHPHAIHTWRQCDGAQIALNYYQQSMNFFEPRLSLYIGNECKMGAEFPIIYYVAACLYKIFGFHECFIRLISLCFFFTGMFFLFKTISLFTEDEYYGAILALMVFTSPLIIDYAFNFLPDVPALSLTFIGYYYCLVFFKSEKSDASLWKATFFFAFAGLLKPTSLMGYFAIIGIMLLQTIYLWRKGNFSFSKLPMKALLGFCTLPVFITGIWVSYMKHYNVANDNTYFLMTTRPYWEMTPEAISEVWDWLHHRWMHAFTYRGFLYALPFVYLLSWILINRNTIRPALWLLMVILQCVAYFVLFFAQFKFHDYYLLPFIIIPVALGSIIVIQIKNRNAYMFHSLYVKGMVFLLFCAMVYYGRKVNATRDFHDGWSYCQAFYDIEPELLKHGINKEDKIISIGDGSSGISLYFMNRRGWTSMTLSHPAAVETDIEDCIVKGAKYVALDTQAEDHLSTGAKEKYLKNEIMLINGIKFYKL